MISIKTSFLSTIIFFLIVRANSEQVSQIGNSHAISEISQTPIHFGFHENTLKGILNTIRILQEHSPAAEGRVLIFINLD